MSHWSRLRFWLAYLLGNTPWDTDITPPELVNTIEGSERLAAGRAIDLGCGTGTNVIYLARHGWEAVGVDFVDKAIERARVKARKQKVDTTFFSGDVTRLSGIAGLSGRFHLALDIGCFHSLTQEQQERYATQLHQWLQPGATYMLYAWAPMSDQDEERGISRERVWRLFGEHLALRHVQEGEERGRPSAWYWLQYS
jgi:cyclopropane fatty-acyl-phospholipid synthase-like methyltransferase